MLPFHRGVNVRVHTYVCKTHCNYRGLKVTLTGSCCFLHNSMCLVKFISGLDLNSYNDNAQVIDATPAPFVPLESMWFPARFPSEKCSPAQLHCPPPDHCPPETLLSWHREETKPEACLLSKRTFQTPLMKKINKTSLTAFLTAMCYLLFSSGPSFT